MRCERAQELFSDYCEGSVSQPLRVTLEDHLAGCPGCRHQVTGLRDVWRMLDASPVVEPPPGFRAAVWQRIDAAEQARAARRPWWSPAPRGWFTRPAIGWAAVGLLLLLLGGVVVPGRYVGANLGLPWRLFAPARPRPLQVQVGDASVRVVDGRTTVTVTLTAQRSAIVRVAVDDPGARVVQGASGLRVGPQGPTQAVVEIIAPGAQPRSLTLRIWEEGTPPVTRTVEVPRQ